MADYLILNFEGEDGATTWVEEAQELEPDNQENCEIDTDYYYTGSSSLKLSVDHTCYVDYIITDMPLNFYYISRFMFIEQPNYTDLFWSLNDIGYDRCSVSLYVEDGNTFLEIVLVDGERNTFGEYKEIINLDGEVWHECKLTISGKTVIVEIDDVEIGTWTAIIDNPLANLTGLEVYAEYTDIWFDCITLKDDNDEYGEYEEPEEPEENPTWISQGKFFIERPTFQVGLNETTTGVWGRQETAILGEPFAQKVTKLWDADTTFYAICQEIIESVGLVWDPDNCDIQDFIIYADNFEADNQYPIETLQSLVELIVGAEGFVTSDRLGNVCIKRLERAPETSDFDLTDLIIQSINEEPEWPEFGNRIKIIPVETVSQNTIVMNMSSECICMSTLVATFVDVWAQVKDGEGTPLNDQVVVWSFYPADPERLGFVYPDTGGPGYSKTVSQNTSEILISKEVVRADSLVSLTTKFEASSIIGIWAYADTARLVNFAADDSYIIDGNKVYLTNDQFNFCDQMVVISYYASGMVMNTVICSGGIIPI